MTPEPSPGALFEPAGLDIAPTVAGAGRRPATIELVNPASPSVQVATVTVESADGAFTIVENLCDGVSLPTGGRCSVTVLFAPVATGVATANLTATSADGATVVAPLSGTGAAPPVVSPVPAVASIGQVVAVRGSGFPAGSVVELTWLDSATVRPVQVDGTGSFVETLVVMRHTPRGPATAVVTAQQDLFATVDGNVLITDTSSRSNSALAGSAAGGPYGR